MTRNNAGSSISHSAQAVIAEIVGANESYSIEAATDTEIVPESVVDQHVVAAKQPAEPVVATDEPNGPEIDTETEFCNIVFFDGIEHCVPLSQIVVVEEGIEVLGTDPVSDVIMLYNSSDDVLQSGTAADNSITVQGVLCDHSNDEATPSLATDSFAGDIVKRHKMRKCGREMW